MSKERNSVNPLTVIATGVAAAVVLLAWQLTDMLRWPLIVAAWAGVVFGVVWCCVLLWQRVTTHNEQEERLQAENERTRAEAAEIRRRSEVTAIVADAGQQVFLSDTAGRHWRAGHIDPRRYANGPGGPAPTPEEAAAWLAWLQGHATAKGSGVTVEAPAQLEAGQPDRPPLLELLAREYRLMLLGPSGSGKSSLLRHTLARKLQTVDQVLLMDPHGSRPKWGAGVDAVGFGEDFDAILQTFRALEWEHQQRIQKIADGHPERAFPTVLVVIEEAQALVSHFKPLKVDIGHYIRMLLSRTRKTAIDLIIVSQSDTVEALGLHGYARNRKALTAVETVGRDGRGHRVRYPTVDGETWEFDPPPYWPDTQPVGVQPAKVLMLPPGPTKEEREVIEMVEAGASNYAICKAMGWRRGASSYGRIEEIKGRFCGVPE